MGGTLFTYWPRLDTRPPCIYAVATFTASRKYSPMTIFTAMIKYFTAIIKYSMYARTCTLLLTYPTQTPLLFSGSRLDRQCFLRFICAHGVAGGLGGAAAPQKKNDQIYMIEFICPTPHPSATASPRNFFNLLIYCRLHKGIKDPVSFTVRNGLLGRLGLGLRVRISIPIIFTFSSEFIINLFRYCNKSRYERHLSNADV